MASGATKDRVRGDGMFCLGCAYPLKGLDTSRCPECGQHYVADSPETFSSTPARSLLGLSVRTTLAALGIGVGVATAIFFGYDLIPRVDEEWVVFPAIGLLLLGCGWTAVRSGSAMRLLAATVGTSWGFMFALSMLISIQNQQVSIVWLALLLALVILPAAGFVLWVPGLLFARWRRKRHLTGLDAKCRARVADEWE